MYSWVIAARVSPQFQKNVSAKKADAEKHQVSFRVGLLGSWPPGIADCLLLSLPNRSKSHTIWHLLRLRSLCDESKASMGRHLKTIGWSLQFTKSIPIRVRVAVQLEQVLIRR